MNISTASAQQWSNEVGLRLKQARLNQNLSQTEVANRAGIARKTVLNAEKGKTSLEIFIAILIALDLTEQLNLFLPKQEISPLQLAKLQGKQRQRASRSQQQTSETQGDQGDVEW